MKSRKILILGCNGFIGSHLVDHLSAQSFDVTGSDRLPPWRTSFHFLPWHQDASGHLDIFKTHSFDYCINAAGNGNVNLSVTHPEEDFNANVQFTFNVLESIRRFCPNCKYLHISSAAVYGNPVQLPIRETDLLSPISPYGWHKQISEQLCRSYFDLYNIHSVIIRPFSVYGPGLKKQLLWDVFSKVNENDGVVELWGTGDETRDYIHILDLARAIEVILMHNPMQMSIYNVGSGEGKTISYVVNLLLKALGKNNTVRFNGKTREGNPLHWQSDISRIKDIGFLPDVKLEQGITALASWLKMQQ